MPASNTKERILDAAQELFAGKGYPATSMREITALADVNLAAINYHFGSKEGLLHALVRQCLEPINRERLECLDAAEAQALLTDDPAPLQQVIRIFLEPALREFQKNDSEMPCILSRVHHEPHPGLDDVLGEIMAPVIERFLAAAQRVLPNHKPEELFLRGHFMIGSLLHLLDSGHRLLHIFPGCSVDFQDQDFLLDQLVIFCTAGFRNA